MSTNSPLEGERLQRRPIPLGLRGAAFFRSGVNVVICAVVTNVLFATCLPVDDYLQLSYEWSEESAELAAGVLVWLPATLWLLWDGMWNGASHGMRKVGLRIERMDGTPAGTLRCALRLAAGALTLPLWPVSLVLFLVDRCHRTVADLLCGTRLAESAPVENEAVPSSPSG